MSRRRFKLPKRVHRALKEAGNYRLCFGGRHIKIYVDDALAGVVPLCVSGDGQIGGRAERNVIASVRRLARQGRNEDGGGAA